MGNIDSVFGHRRDVLEGVVSETRAHDLCPSGNCEYYDATNLLLGFERPRNDLEGLQSIYSPTVLTGRESVAIVGVVWMGPIKLVVKQDSVSTEDIR